MDLIIPTISQGLLWSVLAIGVYLTFRVLDVADLTVEGSFPLGAAVAASLLVAGWSPIPAIFVACFAGMLSGVVTGILTTKFKIPALLSGILTMIALYSVNLRVMGKANLPLLRIDTLFTQFGWISEDPQMVVFAVGLFVVLLIGVLCYWFFGTEIGAAIRATGFNPNMIRANGVNTDVTIILGLLLSNGLVAVSGALVAQSNGFVFGTASFWRCLISVVLGSVVYRIVIAVVLQMGMPPNDLKLFTAILVAAALALPLLQGKVKERRRRAVD